MHALRRLLRTPSSRLGFVLLSLFLFVAFTAPWLAPPIKKCPNIGYYLIPDWILRPILGSLPCEPYKMPRDGFRVVPLPPDRQAWATFPPQCCKTQHPLGTTENRYDIWYGLVWGTRTSLFAGLTIVGLTFLFGLMLGTISGYFGGWVDGVLMRLVDFVYVFPGFLAILVFISIVGPGLDRIIFVSIVLGWAFYARFARGEVLSLRSREFIDASRAVGANPMRIIVRHVIPNMVYPLLILASLDIGSIVLGLAGLSFVGLGSGEDYADWGAMLALARNRILGSVGGNAFEFWYTIVFPGMAIFLFVLAWNLVGNAVRDAFDPRLSPN